MVPGSKDRSEDYNAARVEEAASPLISAGASHIVVVYPNGNTTSFDKNFHLVDLLNRAYPKGTTNYPLLGEVRMCIPPRFLRFFRMRASPAPWKAILLYHLLGN